MAPDGLISADEHACWDAIEAETRAARGEPPRAAAPSPMGTDYSSVYRHPFAPPPSSSKPAGMSYFSGYRSAKGWAAAAQLGLAVTSLGTAIVFWTLWQQRGVLDRIAAADGAFGADITTSDDRVVQWFTLRLLLYLATTVAFLGWFHRGYKNMGAVNPWDPPRRSSGWAIGAWFVPFLNWVWPVSMANEMWRKSESPHATQPSPAGLLWVWWPCYLVGSLGTQMSPQIGESLEAGVTVELLQVLNAVWMVALVASLIAGVSALMLVSSLTERLDRRFMELRVWEESR